MSRSHSSQHTSHGSSTNALRPFITATYIHCAMHPIHNRRVRGAILPIFLIYRLWRYHWGMSVLQFYCPEPKWGCDPNKLESRIVPSTRLLADMLLFFFENFSSMPSLLYARNGFYKDICECHLNDAILRFRLEALSTCVIV